MVAHTGFCANAAFIITNVSKQHKQAQSRIYNTLICGYHSGKNIAGPARSRVMHEESEQAIAIHMGVFRASASLSRNLPNEENKSAGKHGQLGRCKGQNEY